MTKDELHDWFINLSQYKSLVDAIGAYNPCLNYAGPENSKALSFFIPRRLWGIDCNIAFYHHDGLYQIGGISSDRFQADLAMVGTALFIIEKTPDRWYLWGGNTIRRHWARERLIKYFEAVRFGGKKSFTFRPSSL